MIKEQIKSNKTSRKTEQLIEHQLKTKNILVLNFNDESHYKSMEW